MFTGFFGDLFDFDGNGHTDMFELFAAAECCGMFDDKNDDSETSDNEESDDDAFLL